MTVGEFARKVFRGQWPILVVGAIFLAAFGLGHDASEIAHATGRHEQSRFPAKHFGGSRLQTIDRRIFQINIVADFSFGHCPAHRRRGLGHRVAAQIDYFVAHANVIPCGGVQTLNF